MTSWRWRLTFACGAGVWLGAGALAQTNKPEPLKTTVQTCGSYQVKITGNGFGEPQDTLRLMKGGRTYATYRDEAVSLDSCTDLTGDGVPEAILTQYSGGAHCCTMGQIYSLTTPPRLLLEQGLSNSPGWEIVQLDGKGPKELLTSDWRFAYAYGLSYAESPALPQFLAYRGGRYVDVTREYPALLLKGIRAPQPEESVSGTLLSNYALYLLAGQPQKAEAYLQTLPRPEREWLQNYAPDIRQNLSTVGLDDWPQRAGGQGGASWRDLRGGAGGSFTRPGTLEYLGTTVRQGTGAVRLYQQRGGQVVASAPLLSFREPADHQELDPLATFTVRRASGRDDVVLRDELAGRVQLRAYRVSTQRLTELMGDPLGVTVRLLSDVENLGRQRERLTDGSSRTDAQKQALQGRIAAALPRAQAWQKTYDPASKTPLNLAKLGVFNVQSVEVYRENASSALVAGVVEMGDVVPGQGYVQRTRQTFAIFLDNRGGTWQVTRWQLSPRRGAGPLDR